MKYVTLVFSLVLGFAVVVAAQDLTPGRYSMEWSNLHVPVSSDSPDLTTGTSTVDIVPASSCPPTSKWELRGAPVGPVPWCIREGGAFDTSVGPSGIAGGIQVWRPNGTGGFDMFHAEGEHGSRGSDTVHAVGRRLATTSPPPAPPPAGYTVSMTSPRQQTTPQVVSGVIWPIGWMAGTTSTSNKFEVLVDGVAQTPATTISTKGPASIRWDTRSVPNGTHTVRVRGTSASGSALSAPVTVRVAN